MLSNKPQTLIQRPLVSKEVLMTEDDFMLDLQEAENNILKLTLDTLPLTSMPSPVQQLKRTLSKAADVPLISRLLSRVLSVDKEIPKPTSENLISLLEVSQHDSMDDCWIVVYDRVYNITKFLHSHPGGYDVIMEHAGRDSTFAFRGAGHSAEAVEMLKKYEIGILPMEERLYRHETLIFRWGELPE